MSRKGPSGRGVDSGSQYPHAPPDAASASRTSTVLPAPASPETTTSDPAPAAADAAAARSRVTELVALQQGHLREPRSRRDRLHPPAIMRAGRCRPPPVRTTSPAAVTTRAGRPAPQQVDRRRGRAPARPWRACSPRRRSAPRRTPSGAPAPRAARSPGRRCGAAPGCRAASAASSVLDVASAVPGGRAIAARAPPARPARAPASRRPPAGAPAVATSPPRLDQHADAEPLGDRGRRPVGGPRLRRGTEVELDARRYAGAVAVQLHRAPVGARAHGDPHGPGVRRDRREVAVVAEVGEGAPDRRVDVAAGALGRVERDPQELRQQALTATGRPPAQASAAISASGRNREHARSTSSQSSRTIARAAPTRSGSATTIRAVVLHSGHCAVEASTGSVSTSGITTPPTWPARCRPSRRRR